MSVGDRARLGWISTTVFSTPDKVRLAITPATALGWTAAQVLASGRSRRARPRVGRSASSRSGSSLVLGAVLLWRSRRENMVRNLGIALIAVAVCGPAAWPWYLTWGLVLLAACPGSSSRERSRWRCSRARSSSRPTGSWPSRSGRRPCSWSCTSWRGGTASRGRGRGWRRAAAACGAGARRVLMVTQTEVPRSRAPQRRSGPRRAGGPGRRGRRRARVAYGGVVLDRADRPQPVARRGRDRRDREPARFGVLARGRARRREHARLLRAAPRADRLVRRRRARDPPAVGARSCRRRRRGQPARPPAVRPARGARRRAAGRGQPPAGVLGSGRTRVRGDGGARGGIVRRVRGVARGTAWFLGRLRRAHDAVGVRQLRGDLRRCPRSCLRSRCIDGMPGAGR